MKKILNKVSLVAVGVIIGFISGYAPHSFFSRDPIGAEIASAIEAQVLVSLLNHGKVDDAKRLLNLKLDSSILSIHSSLEHTGQENRAAAAALFRGVAKMRKDYPSDDSETPTLIREKVSAILERHL